MSQKSSLPQAAKSVSQVLMSNTHDVKASTSAGTIGRDVIESTIKIGIPPEVLKEIIRQHAQHSEAQKQLIEELRGKLDINLRQVRTALEILDEANVPADRLAVKLVEVAKRFKALQARATIQPGDDAVIAALRIEAQKAIEAGELAKADTVLAKIETEQRRSLDRLAVNVAKTSAQHGEIALTRLHYAEAAQHFANAAAVFPPGSAHDGKRVRYLRMEAAALYRQGDKFGDNAALRAAIERYKRLIDVNPRVRLPLEWARTQNNLGTALQTLGERERGTARLEQAVAAYRAALEELTRARVPLAWAATQMNLGNALSMLGERGTARLEQALAAYSAALEELTRARLPFEWARTQMNLGNALSTLARASVGRRRG